MSFDPVNQCTAPPRPPYTSPKPSRSQLPPKCPPSPKKNNKRERDFHKHSTELTIRKLIEANLQLLNTEILILQSLNKTVRGLNHSLTPHS